MKKFELWLTIVIVFSLPALVFAQATGGSTCSKVKDGTTKSTGGRKHTAHAEVIRKGAGNAPKTTGNGNTPKLEAPIEKNQACTGKKPNNKPTTTARKKPPRPAPAKPPNP